MKKSYLILAHKNPEQLKMLVDTIAEEEAFFHIHIDKNSDITPFKEALVLQKNVIFVAKRESASWGDIGAVLATLNCMKSALETTKEGYCILLSGQDFPLQPKTVIDSYLNTFNGCQFIDITPLDTVIKSKEWQVKLECYKYNFSTKKGNYTILPPLTHRYFYTLKTLKSALKILWHSKNINLIEVASNTLKKRKAPQGIVPYAGGQWWALTTDMVAQILTFLEKNSAFIAYHKHTLLPDELFFQSLLMHFAENEASIKFKNCFTYANFTRKNCYLPVVFQYDETDKTELLSLDENWLFARKFDTTLDDKIVLFLVDKLQNK